MDNDSVFQICFENLNIASGQPGHHKSAKIDRRRRKRGLKGDGRIREQLEGI
jgi:hypothetical protein